MRLAPIIILAACVALTACSPANSAHTPTPPPSVATTEPLISVDPRLLVLPDADMIPGKWSSTEGTLAYPQWNRAWDRDPADPGYATGATRITSTARLYLSIVDSSQDFEQTAKGSACTELAYQTLQARGFPRSQVKVTDVTLDPLGGEHQWACRAEFTRGSVAETYVQYFAFVHVKNTRAIMTAYAQNQGGQEAPKLLDDLKEFARRQANHLLSLPATPQQIRATTPSATAVGTQPSP
jgi:hypothetical protein